MGLEGFQEMGANQEPDLAGGMGNLSWSYRNYRLTYKQLTVGT